MLKSVAIGLVATTIAASIAPALAATTILGELQGDVLVNSGKGFQPVAAPMSLELGNTVMVRAGGDAQIAYADGCISKVVPGKVVVIGPDSPCAMAKATLQQPYITGAVDVVGAAGAAGAAETAGAAGAAGTAGAAGVAGVSSGAIAAGGAAAAAVAAGVLVYTKYIKPASP